jgi:hypothetical protein
VKRFYSRSTTICLYLCIYLREGRRQRKKYLYEIVNDYSVSRHVNVMIRVTRFALIRRRPNFALFFHRKKTISFDKNWVGINAGQYFDKIIWSSCFFLANQCSICSATFFSEFQISELQIFERHFTENRPKSKFSKRQKFDTIFVRNVTSSNFMFSNRQIVDQFCSNFV